MEVSVTAFAVLGAVTTAQQVAGTCLQSMDGADPELVAEESLALLSVVTARCLRGRDEASHALASLPLTYRDYVVGARILEDGAESQEIMQAEGASYERIARKVAFYEAHFPAGKLPGPLALKDKMELWMGRISPPGLPEHPSARLEKLGLVDLVTTHVRLVRAFSEQGD